MPQVHVPFGMEAIELPDGSIEVRKKSDAMLNQTISLRMTTADHNSLLPFIESFPTRRAADAFRWLLGHPDVKSIMAERVRSSVQAAPQ